MEKVNKRKSNPFIALLAAAAASGTTNKFSLSGMRLHKPQASEFPQPICLALFTHKAIHQKAATQSHCYCHFHMKSFRLCHFVKFTNSLFAAALS